MRAIRPLVPFVLILSCLVLLCAMANADSGSGSPGKVLEADAFQQVLDDTAAQVVAELPDDIHFRLLAIGPIEGDDGRLAQALTVKIKSGTNYHLIERGDLDRLLEEQGVQLSPISDERRPVTPGKIKGVEGLLMGKIRAKRDTPFFSSIDVYLKLDNVEGGDIVFAQHFSARCIPAITYYLAGLIGILIFMLICANRIRKAKTRRTEKLVQKDSGSLLALQSDIRQAKDNINRVHDQLVAQGQMDLSVAVQAVRDDLADLQARLERTPAVSLQAMEKGTPKGLKSHTGSMQRLIKNIAAESDRVGKAAQSDKSQKIMDALDNLKAEVALAAGWFEKRPAGKS